MPSIRLQSSNEEMFEDDRRSLTIQTVLAGLGIDVLRTWLGYQLTLTDANEAIFQKVIQWVWQSHTSFLNWEVEEDE